MKIGKMKQEIIKNPEIFQGFLLSPNSAIIIKLAKNKTPVK
jgi:hypothetical protein